MVDETNPYEVADERGQQATTESKLSVARVSTVPSTTTSGLYHVEVRSLQYPDGEVALLLPTVHGDIYFPREGDDVLVRERDDNTLVVLKAVNTDVTVPSIKVGERVITHPASDARVYFEADGTLHVDGDVDVVINDGTQRPVVDVDTTTDGDGHVTGITLDRADNVFM